MSSTITFLNSGTLVKGKNEFQVECPGLTDVKLTLKGVSINTVDVASSAPDVVGFDYDSAKLCLTIPEIDLNLVSESAGHVECCSFSNSCGTRSSTPVFDTFM